MRLSLVIPTINRPEALQRLLQSLCAQDEPADEIIIVDQGESVADLVAEFPTLPIKYLRLSPPSLTKARTTGVAAASGDIIGFLDDDCRVEPEYSRGIRRFFSGHPDAKGVQGIIVNFVEGQAGKAGGGRFLYALYNLYAKFFLLNNSSARNLMLLSGRNQYAAFAATVSPCEWLSGVGNYRRDIFSEFSFDASLAGYALGEDKLFSHQINAKYPGSLFVDPAIRLYHDHAANGRPKDEAWVAMKVENTAYVWKKLFGKSRIAALAFWWANAGDTLSALIAGFIGKRPWRFGWWHLKAYWHIIWKKS